MKNSILKPLAIATFMAGGLFSCAGSGEVADNTGLEPAEVVVTETEVATATTPDGTTVVVTDTDVVAEETVLVPDTERLANNDIDYRDMFDDIEDTEQYNVLALAKMTPELSTFVTLLEATGLAPSLAAAEPVTLFAPTNAVFNKMSKDRLEELLNADNRVELVELLNLHILPGAEASTLQLTESTFIDRGDEDEDIPVSVEANGTIVFVGGAQIVKGNVEASNGVLHVVNDIIQTTEEAGADID